jgi:O-antigen ligase
MWQDASAQAEVGEDGYLKEGFSARWRLWMRGIELMLEHPFLGVGAGAFPVAEAGETFRDLGRGGYLGAHNSFIQVGAELGILGIVLFVYLLYRAIRNYRMVLRTAGTLPQLRYHLWTAHGFETATYGYIIAGSALNQGFSAILYFLVGMSVVLKWRTLRDRAELDDGKSRQADAEGSIPWWKAPR